MSVIGVFLKFLALFAVIIGLQACTLDASLKNIDSSLTGTSPDQSVTIKVDSPYASPTNISSYLTSGACKEEGAQVEVLNSSQAVLGNATCSSGTWSLNLDLSAAPEGTLSFVARMTSSTGTSVSTTPVEIIKDTTPPNSASMAPLLDGTYSNSLVASTMLSWSPASDGGSGLSHYELALGTTVGGTDLLNWTAIGDITSTQRSGLSLAEGSTYFPSLRAVDKSGNVSSVISGDGWSIDVTNPLAATSFSDGVMSFSSTDSPLMSWLAGSDAASGLSGYEIAVGTSSGATDILNWSSVGNILATALNSLTLTGATKYYASVRSRDNAGNTSAVALGDSWYNFKQSKLAVDVTNPQARWGSTNANLGASVALSKDGLTMVVGAPADSLDANGGNYVNSTGAAFVYIKSGGIWVLQQKLVAEGTNARWASDSFGRSVAISGDTVVVGAPQQDHDESGNNLLTDAGAVYVFTRSGSIWSQQQKIVATGTNARVSNDAFGSKVAIDGDTLVVGAP